MRHRVAGKKLNRSTHHRQSLFKNLALSLVEHGEIQTTVAKAKVLKRIIDKLITQAKKNTAYHRRQLSRFFGKRQPANKLVTEIAPALQSRTSGYSRIIRLGNRSSDNALMVKIELVTPPSKTPSSLASKDKTKAIKEPLKSGKTPTAPQLPPQPVRGKGTVAPELINRNVASSRASTQKRGER